MEPDASYVDVNRAMWDERAPAHAASPDYAVRRFADDPAHISDVVAFDRPLLGSIEGRRGVHLQCHIGTDTVPLARLGARMTGLDFSAPPWRKRGGSPRPPAPRSPSWSPSSTTRARSCRSERST